MAALRRYFREREWAQLEPGLTFDDVFSHVQAAKDARLDEVLYQPAEMLLKELTTGATDAVRFRQKRREPTCSARWAWRLAAKETLLTVQVETLQHGDAAKLRSQLTLWRGACIVDQQWTQDVTIEAARLQGALDDYDFGAPLPLPPTHSRRQAPSSALNSLFTDEQRERLSPDMNVSHIAQLGTGNGTSLRCVRSGDDRTARVGRLCACRA